MQSLSSRSLIPQANWQVRTSIALELDIVLSALSGHSAGLYQSEDFQTLLAKVPQSWRDELKQLPISFNQNSSLLEIAAYMAGVLFEDNYNFASQTVRELEPKIALERLVIKFSEYSIFKDASLSLSDQLVDLEIRGLMAVYQSIGYDLKPESALAQKISADCRFAVSILKGGQKHDAFWQWLDRFYDEIYSEWRSSYQSKVDLEKQRAYLELEQAKGPNFTNRTNWLPKINPLVNSLPLRQAAQSGNFEIVFWAEPFNLMDTWSIFPECIMVSFAEPGVGLVEFQKQILDLTNRASALGDPTRLTILHLIRHFGLVNTEIANYLGLARPTVSVHAKILRDAGLITSKKVGREMRHEIKWDEMKNLMIDLEHFLEIPE